MTRVKDYANRVKSKVPLRTTNLKPKTKYIPRRVSATYRPSYGSSRDKYFSRSFRDMTVHTPLAFDIIFMRIEKVLFLFLQFSLVYFFPRLSLTCEWLRFYVDISESLKDTGRLFLHKELVPVLSKNLHVNRSFKLAVTSGFALSKLLCLSQ